MADTHLDTIAADIPHMAAASGTEPAARHWQDDGRFAVALLVIVIAVNLLVTAWLGSMQPDAPAPAPGSAAVASPPSLIDQLREAGANATEQ